MTADSSALARAMPGMPRLKPAKPRRLSRGNPLRFRPWIPGRAWGDVMGERPVGGRIRAVRRIATVLLITLFAMVIQAALLLVPGNAKRVFPIWYYRAVCWAIGLKVRTVGTPSGVHPTLFVANHSSWLDIIVLGSQAQACFVSKAEVGTWPLIGWIAKLGRTVFVSRARGRTGSEANELRARIAAGDSFVLFPEGTTSDGGRVLPFRSSFLAVADAAARVQPVTLVYDRLHGLPACRRDRPVFAWYGDMETGSHAWRLLRRTGTRATILFHGDFAPNALPDRKAMASHIERVVAEGAAALRQNREARPAPAPAARG